MLVQQVGVMTSESANEVNKLESVYIKKYQSNNPEVGYNLWPKFKA